MDKSKICGNCHYYTNSPLHGPWCTKNRKEVSYLQTAYDCWTALEEEPTLTPAPTTTPEPSPATTSEPEPKRSRGGRVSRHPKYVDRETGHTMKWCSICNQYKPIDEFHLNKSKKDGHAGECKLCHNAQAIEYQRKRAGRRHSTSLNNYQDNQLKIKTMDLLIALVAFVGGVAVHNGRNLYKALDIIKNLEKDVWQLRQQLELDYPKNTEE